MNFFFEFFCFCFFFKWYIHKQSSLNATWNFWIQENIETWNRQTNFKLNHDVANHMWSEAKLGHLLLLGPFRMLKTWWAWTLIMIFWYMLEMAWVCTWKAWTLIMIFGYLLEMAWAHTWKASILWAFGLWCWSYVYTFDGLKYWA